jgi:3-oxoacyl-[acyl-carrier-protein] synthase-3
MSLPERLVTNDEVAEWVGIDRSWFDRRTGTRERHWAAPGERLSALAAQAGAQALERAGLPGSALDLVVVATASADEISPNAAPLVAGLLGASRAGAFDVGAACTGWLTALAMASGQIEAGRVEHALVVGAEILSRFVDVRDRDTAALFADGAGAAVLSPARATGAGVGPVILRSDAEGANLIRLEHAGSISLRGPDTFRAAVEAMSSVTLEALEVAGWSLQDVDLFVYHQANARIIRAVGERLGLEPARVVDYVARFANTSAATIPIALCVAEAEGRLAPGARVLLSAFGGGFTWGAATLVWGA